MKEKLIISGKTIEYMTFSGKNGLGVPINFKKRVNNYSSKKDCQFSMLYSSTSSSLKIKEYKSRVDNINRSRKNLRRLVQSNEKRLNKFLTLTFAENETDIKKANKKFEKFIKRLRYKFGDIQYIAVPEYQKRGAVHYHIIINLPYIPKKKLDDLRKIWGNGWIDLQKCKSFSGDIGVYLSKYITKDYIQSKNFKQRKYFVSSKVRRPLVYINHIAKDILSSIDHKIKACEFSVKYYNEYLGDVSYKIYSLLSYELSLSPP